MSTVVTQVSGTEVEPFSDDRLLKLFWNRHELKKAFASLRAERDTLKDRLRQQEGDLLRAQQRLEQLEGYLADPQQAANAAVYYQLHGLWQHCHRRLVRLRKVALDEAAVAERESLRKVHVARLAAEVSSLDDQLASNARHIRAAKQTLVDAQRKATGLKGLLFRQRTRESVERLQAELDAAIDTQDRLNAERAERAARVMPEPGELSVEARREVNLRIIAMAQELALFFAENEIAALARSATLRNLRDMDFGSPADCRRISRRAARRLLMLEAFEQLPAMADRRTRYLASGADYRLGGDTVPVQAGCANIPPRLDSYAQPAARDHHPLNVLAEDYWDVYSVLVS